MLSLITSNAQFPKLYNPVRMNSRLLPSLIFEFNPKGRDRRDKKAFTLKCCFSLTELRRAAPNFGRDLDNYWCRCCSQSEGDIELEEEIMDFMAKSEKPTMFPTKDQLMRAGRFDLVEAIKKRGGWYFLGWQDENVGDNDEEGMNFNFFQFQRRVERCKDSATSKENCNGTFSGDDKEDCFSDDLNSSSANLHSLQVAASALFDRSPQIIADEDSGIDGILIRLGKQRKSDFGINLEAPSRIQNNGDDRLFNISPDSGRTCLEENGRKPGYNHKGTFGISDGSTRHYTEPETWRSWSNQRAGFLLTEFEAAEISLSSNRVDTDEEIYHDGIIVTTKEYCEDLDQHKEINCNEIRTRLQHLGSVLSSALHSLRSKMEDCNSKEVHSHGFCNFYFS